MDGHNGFHRRFQHKRQGLGGLLGGILGGNPTPSASAMSPAASQSTANSDPLGLGGIVNGLTSLVGSVPTMILPLGPSSVTTTSSTLTSSSSTAGTTTTTSKTTSTSTTTSSTSTSTTPTSTPTPTPTSSDVVYTSTQGPNIVYITSTPVASPTTPAAPKSFLQNPSEEGPVFALIGIAALILIFIITTWTMRKRRRDRLERDLAAAVTFDPTVTDRYEERESSIEKHRLSGSSSGHGHGYGYGVQPAYAAPQQGYYGPTGYGQFATPAPYRAPSPNPVPYQATSPAPPQPAAQGGANLQRKFSDRKPVPPLLPTPAYDPSATQVSLPSPFYQQ